jgi:WG containing repeat
MNSIKFLSFIVAIFCFGQTCVAQDDYWLRVADEKTDTYGYVDRAGDVKIPLDKYLTCYTDTFRNFAIVSVRNFGFAGINRSEKVLFKVYPFDNGPDEPSEGLFRIIKGDLIGFANMNGEVLISPKFAAVGPFSGEYAMYCRGCHVESDGEHEAWVGGKWGFIDKKGRVAIKPIYDDVSSFKNGKSQVKLDGKEFWIDEKGRRTTEPASAQ